jgi:hypothetical protein
MRRYIVLGFFALVLTSGPETLLAQMRVPGQPGTPTPQPPIMPPAYIAVQANICSTEWGWCHLPALTPRQNAPCGCLTSQNQIVAGHTLYFPMPGGPVSPYLQPHISGTPDR